MAKTPSNSFEHWWAVVSVIVGLVIIKWQSLLSIAGLSVEVDREEATIAFEYWLGLIAAGVLGYVFPRRAALAGLLLMLGPVFIIVLVHVARDGVPNLWPIEVMFTAVLAIPYIVCAALVAYLTQRRRRTQNAT